MTAVRGILFDKDGTLIDFRATWVTATVAAADATAASAYPHDSHAGERRALARRLTASIGYDLEADALDPASLLARGSMSEIARRWAALGPFAARAGMVDSILEKFHDSAVAHAVPVMPLAPFFGRLRRRGLRLGVATMDSTRSARAMFDNLGVGQLIDFLAGYDGGHGEKPGPGMVHGFCAEMGLNPSEVMVVGDSMHDLEMARAASAGLAVAVLSGVADQTHFRDAADHVIGGIGEIEALLDRIGART